MHIDDLRSYVDILPAGALLRVGIGDRRGCTYLPSLPPAEAIAKCEAIQADATSTTSAIALGRLGLVTVITGGCTFRLQLYRRGEAFSHVTVGQLATLAQIQGLTGLLAQANDWQRTRLATLDENS